MDKLEVLQAVDYQENFPYHFHDRICITLVNRGIECTNKNDMELITPCQGISVTPQNEVHANPNKNLGSYSFVTYYISPDVFRYVNLQKDYVLTHSIIEDKKLYEDLLGFALSPINTEKTFLSALQYFFQNYVEMANGTVEMDPISSIDLQNALDYLKENFHRPISIEKLSQITGMSKYRFIRAFKKKKGITPGQYIILKRIAKAKQLLRDEHTILDATYSSGFFDQSHMHRNFKRFIGVTPLEYQKACNIIQDF